MREPTLKKQASYSAPALERGFDILELLATTPGGLTISEIAQQLCRSVSEVFRVTVVMEQRGWLRKNQQTDQYAVSYWMLDVAYRATPAQALATVAAPIMQDLATKTNQSCHLVVRADLRGLVIQRHESIGPSGFAMRTGAIIDLVTSCSGHVLLAFETDTRRAAIVDALKPDRKARAMLKRRLIVVRDQGYEMTPSVRTSGVTDISVPIFGFEGGIVAALTVPYLLLIDGSQTITIDKARTSLIAAGRDVSMQLGARVDVDGYGSTDVHQPT